jgi:hypothetical protein
VDKQAAARCWRDGQKKRCFTYRFLATGTVEEKIFQRQLSKEGLQSIVDDKEQVNSLSTKDLRNLFKLRTGTPSDTHDKLRCERCQTVSDDAEQEAIQVLPKQLSACSSLLEIMLAEADASYFKAPLKPNEHGVTVEQYEKAVKQPMDLSTIKTKLCLEVSDKGSYKSPSAFSKDVNRIFSNVMKVWDPGHELADAARRLQSWWTEQWANLVPNLMRMKPDENDEQNSALALEDSDENQIASAFCHNERGEDYQEQIGMPDEENMRHWSHHHSTDTVDDPVFRAAMRGFDDVSFVFGLEVTWSLIQQRQQEEEERQAMLELECIEEMDDDEEEVEAKQSTLSSKESCTKKDDIDELTIRPAVTEDTEVTTDDDDDYDNDGSWYISRIFTKDEIMSSNASTCERNHCDNTACSLWKSKTHLERALCFVCQKEKFDGFPVGLEPQDPVHKDVITKFCSGPLQSSSTVTNSSSSPADSTSGTGIDVSAVVVWACSQCTFENKAKSKKCVMCGSAKSQKKRRL